MLLASITIPAIVMPILYIEQQTIPDSFSISKIIQPIALIIAGVIINHILAYILPIISEVGLFIFSMLYIKID